MDQHIAILSHAIVIYHVETMNDDEIRAELQAWPRASMAALEAEPARVSHTEYRLLRLCALGTISPTMAAWLAEGVMLDGVDSPGVRRLARAGAHGQYAGNIRRDLFRHQRKEFLIERPEHVELYVDAGHGKVSLVQHPILPPAAIVNALFIKNREIFIRLVVGSSPREFGNQVKPDDPKLAALGDMMAIPDWQDRAIPFVIHGDKAQFTIKNHRSLWPLQ